MLPRWEPETAGVYAGQTGEPIGYVFQGNTIQLLPAPTSGTIRLGYQQRPGKLVLTTACAQVADFDSVSEVLFLADDFPSTWVITDTFDVVHQTPNFSLGSMDLPISAITDDPGVTHFTDVTLVDNTPASMVVGDWFCLAGETCIPQLPQELHALLAQQTAYVIADATGSARLGAIEKARDRLQEELTMLLSPRSDGSARPIVSRSRIGRWNMGW